MLRIDNIKIPVKEENQLSLIKEKCARLLGIGKNDIIELRILRRSIDARKKPDVMYQYQVIVFVKKGIRTRRKKGILEYKKNTYRLPEHCNFNERPVVVGFGPAGIFASYLLALCGANPIVIERGKKVEERLKDVQLFHEKNLLNTKSNVQFGEGGAGTFSDGKLATQKNDKFGRNEFVLNTFVKFGAESDILIDAKPHIGTDLLVRVIKNIRNEIIRLGGEIRFETTLKTIEYDSSGIKGIYTENEFIPCKNVILSVGHSARDTFEYLNTTDVSMCAKPFAVGFRAEHPQSFISNAQYGKSSIYLPAADYKLVTKNTLRSVYSFCMCPGGYVINSSSEEGRLCVNGMSDSKRDSANANSAIVVGVSEKEFDINDPLGGMKYQRKLEEKAFRLSDGNIPQQLFGDFKNNVSSTTYGGFSSLTKGKASLCNLRGLLGNELEEILISGINEANKYIPGFSMDEMILSGVESRTSSPVRIPRDENFESISMKGLFPCGEGAGYAGGITSAAMDGLKVAEKLIEKTRNKVVK